MKRPRIVARVLGACSALRRGQAEALGERVAAAVPTERVALANGRASVVALDWVEVRSFHPRRPRPWPAEPSRDGSGSPHRPHSPSSWPLPFRRSKLGIAQVGALLRLAPSNRILTGGAGGPSHVTLTNDSAAWPSTPDATPPVHTSTDRPGDGNRPATGRCRRRHRLHLSAGRVIAPRFAARSHFETVRFPQP